MCSDYFDMMLIVDSGSTKTDWLLVKNNSEIDRIVTGGINPVFHDSVMISNMIRACKNLIDYADEITSVYYYGAGCSNDKNKAIVKNAMQLVFSDARITVEHDLLGSALSVCNNHPGIVCILGTGSNCCFYDGENVTPSKHGLGYILGDEGSGSYFGKKIVASYLYDQLPNELKNNFEDKFVSDRSKIIDTVYNKKNANLYLASFAPFLSDNISNAFIKK